MAGRNADSVTIVKRKKVVVAGGHHGGAWKVAYADFVTAMMAFFLLMWLISVSDEETKLGLADYFSPTIPVHSTVGGGDGPFFGMNMFSMDLEAQDARGQTGDIEPRSGKAGDESLADVQNELLGASGDAVEADPLLRHIRTRLTDEGLIIEVFDIEGSPLFAEGAAVPNPILLRLLDMIGRVLARTENPVAITGHLARGDAGEAVDPWLLSSDRAQRARGLLVAAGVRDDRLDRVTGRADRTPSTDAPSEARNRRIEITLLRRFTPSQ
jgi:chemotaxis protein MotB